MKKVLSILTLLLLGSALTGCAVGFYPIFVIVF